jgi:transcriptional regulator with GAF, ATPase, and Fis domain
MEGATFDDVVLPHLDAAYRLARWLLRNDNVQTISLLVLREVEGFSDRELAEVTNVRIGTVMSRLSRARRSAIGWTRSRDEAHALPCRSGREENMRLKSSHTELVLPETAGGQSSTSDIVGESLAIVDLIRRIDLVAATRSTVLITGETGTGKELVARAVHARSREREQPFVKVNCAAIPESLQESELFGHVKGAFTDATTTRKGKFSLAHGGSIFLDEIGKMSAGLQGKLLRVLQEREVEPLGADRTERVDVRVIAATNRDLLGLVREGQFQADLYYRLHVIPIVVPPLRARLEDIPLLVDHFVRRHAERNRKSIVPIEREIVASLQQYHWPGNVRELEHTIERAIVLTTGSRITADFVTMGGATGAPPCEITSLKLRQNKEWVERETIRRALAAAPQKQAAARLMGISPRALSHYLSKYPSIEADGVLQ